MIMFVFLDYIASPSTKSYSSNDDDTPYSDISKLSNFPSEILFLQVMSNYIVVLFVQFLIYYFKYYFFVFIPFNNYWLHYVKSHVSDTMKKATFSTSALLSII